jgi:acyl carrier protein
MNEALFLKNFTDNIDGIDASVVTLDTSLKDISQWDSMAILTTLAMIDTEYNLQIPGAEIQQAVYVRDLCAAVAKRLSK